MEFELDEDQQLLQQVVRETVARSRSQTPDQLWRTYQDLGWLEAPPVELAIVLEELGYAADPTPFLATATWFAPLAGRLPRGTGTAVCDGTGRFVLDADRADEIALATSRGVVIASGAEVRAEPVATFDPTLRLAHVSATDLVPRIPDLTLMGLAISAVGACRHILDLAVGAREAAGAVRRADRLVPGGQAQGRGHVRGDRAGPGAGLLLRADHRRGRPAARPGGPDGQGGRRGVPAGGVQARPAALRRDGLHLGERAADLPEAGQGVRPAAGDGIGAQEGAARPSEDAA